jgi:hypothetical protein
VKSAGGRQEETLHRPAVDGDIRAPPPAISSVFSSTPQPHSTLSTTSLSLTNSTFLNNLTHRRYSPSSSSTLTLSTTSLSLTNSTFLNDLTHHRYSPLSSSLPTTRPRPVMYPHPLLTRPMITQSASSSRSLFSSFWILGTGYWVLDTGYWILDTGYWVLDTGYWILDTGYWILDTGYWILDTGLRRRWPFSGLWIVGSMDCGLWA